MRLLTAGAPFTLFPLLFVWRWIALPPKLATEKVEIEGRLKPAFRMYFDPDLGITHPAEAYPTAAAAKERNSTYVRVHFACVTDAPVVGCSIFLTKLEKARHGGAFEDQRLHHPIDMWTAHRFDVLPVVGANVDLLRVNKADNALTPPSFVEWPHHMRGAFAEPAIYRMTLSAICGLQTETIVLDVDWRGGWDSLTARVAA